MVPPAVSSYDAVFSQGVTIGLHPLPFRLKKKVGLSLGSLGENPAVSCQL